MRTLTLAVTAVLCMQAAASAAQARSAFFVQLGAAQTEAEAEALWEALKTDYPALLDTLEYSPRTVTPVAGGAAEYRVQAGPAKSREQARRICTALQNKSKECFMVETAMFDGAPSFPRTASGDLSRKPLPAQLERIETQKAAPAAEATEAETVTAVLAPQESAPNLPPEAAPTSAPVTDPESPLPWRTAAAAPQEAPPAETAQPAAAPARKGRVDVAEAIPVPLSADTPPPAPEVEHKLVTVTKGTAPLMLSGSSAGTRQASAWVQIAGFAGEQDAHRFSEALRERIGRQPSLRMRVNKPLVRTAGVSLNVGPVASEDDASAICAFAAEYNRGLHCSGDLFDAYSRNAARTPAGSYPKPLAVATASGAQPAYTSTPRPPRMAKKPGSYYVQLGSWRNPAGAAQRWEELRKTAGDVLKPYRPDIRAPQRSSINAQPLVRLRVGPFSGREEANGLCGTLTKRGISCLVVGE